MTIKFLTAKTLPLFSKKAPSQTFEKLLRKAWSLKSDTPEIRYT